MNLEELFCLVDDFCKETRREKLVAELKSKRRLVETVISQLVERFDIEKARVIKSVYFFTRRWK